MLIKQKKKAFKNILFGCGHIYLSRKERKENVDEAGVKINVSVFESSPRVLITEERKKCFVTPRRQKVEPN